MIAVKPSTDGANACKFQTRHTLPNVLSCGNELCTECVMRGQPKPRLLACQRLHGGHVHLRNVSPEIVSGSPACCSLQAPPTFEMVRRWRQPAKLPEHPSAARTKLRQTVSNIVVKAHARSSAAKRTKDQTDPSKQAWPLLQQNLLNVCVRPHCKVMWPMDA